MYLPIDLPLFAKHAPELFTGMWVKSAEKFDEEKLAQELGANASASLHQMHGGKAVRVRSGSHRELQGDGIFTDVPKLLLTIRWADCQNFVIYAPKQKVFGVVHVGWRCLLAQMLPNAYALLESEWGISPKETIVYAGPSLCQKSADFTDPKKELPGIDEKYISGNTVDLQQVATDTLRSLGVRSECFFRHPDCTRCDPKTYWTYRGGDREKVINGYVNASCAMLLG